MHNNEYDHKYFCDDICELKRQLTNTVCHVTSAGLDSVDTNEAGAVIDMIKDLAEAEKYCLESKYYETVIEAMEEGQKEPRYKPYIDQEPYVNKHISKHGRSGLAKNREQRIRSGVAHA